MTVVRVLGLTVLWCALTREASLANAALGLGVSILLVRAATGVATERVAATLPRHRVKTWLKPLWALELAGYFLWELLRANLRIAVVLLRPASALRPAVVAVPVEARSEAELALLSDLITLTPGTLTLDASPGGDTLYVHVMGADPESVRDDIQNGLAVRVRRLFS